MLALCLATVLGTAARARAVEWSTLFTAQDVRDHLSTPEGRAEALEFCRKMGITKVYIEAFRGGYQADAETLKTARDFFRKAGLKVSGCVTTVGLGKPSTGWHVAACYTNHANQEKLASVFRFAAGIFDEIMIDDFFFTDCECSECSAAKGDMSWPQYRDKLMVEMARDRVLGPAREVNPKVKIILKFPQWYDNYQNRGYVVDKETALFDRIWVGTETRDPSSDQWGHKQQYEGFFLYRWFAEIGGAKTGGGWFDTYGTDATTYLDQALTTVLAGAPEVFLFHYGALASPEFHAQAEALALHRRQFETIARYAHDWGGIPAYKPISSDGGHEEYIFDQIGMLGIPLVPTAHFPEGARAALFTAHALHDTDFVPELTRFLKAGGTAFLSQELAHRLNADPRLPVTASLDLGKEEYLKTLEAGGSKLVIFSDALPRLTYVDDQNRVAQPSEAESAALAAWRKAVADFTVTLADAPPRVAAFPLGGRVAVVNYTELPVACGLQGMAGMARRYTKVYATAGALLASDGSTLRLPPHSVLIVE
jgi:hypothetical protein